MGRVELSFVLPAFNEVGSIVAALDSLDRVVKDVSVPYEIVVVDDGSCDGTCLQVADYASRNGHVKVVSYERNLGKGHALRRGFVEASGDSVVFVDSDLEIDMGRVVSYVEALRRGDIVIASKYHRESVVDMPLIRKVLGLGFNLLVRLLTGVGLRDTQTGLKAVRKSALRDVFPRLSVKGYAFDVELLAVARLCGLRVVEMPVDVRMRGLFSFREVWRMFLDLLGIAYRLRVVHWYQRVLRVEARSRSG